MNFIKRMFGAKAQYIMMAEDSSTPLLLKVIKKTKTLLRFIFW